METHINFYASEETAVFQKPTFEWVWKLLQQHLRHDR